MSPCCSVAGTPHSASAEPHTLPSLKQKGRKVRGAIWIFIIRAISEVRGQKNPRCSETPSAVEPADAAEFPPSPRLRRVHGPGYTNAA